MKNKILMEPRTILEPKRFELAKPFQTATWTSFQYVLQGLGDRHDPGVSVGGDMEDGWHCSYPQTGGYIYLSELKHTRLFQYYTGCACISGNSTAVPGLCESSCSNLYPYIAVMFFGAFTATLGMMPGFIVTIRSVEMNLIHPPCSQSTLVACKWVGK